MSILTMFLDKPQFQQETTATKKAQALVITLLVLAIVSIVVIGIVVVSNRDVTQVVNNEKYERLYNEAEVKLQEVIETNGITTLPASCDAGTLFPSYKLYSCGTAVQNSDTLAASVELAITDRKIITDYTLSKDRSLDLGLDGYAGEIQFRWSKPIAMEFNIIYTDSFGVVKSIKDVYDLGNVYDSLVGKDPNNDNDPMSPNIHDINFQVLDNANQDKTTKFTISSTNGINLGTTISLRVTPRSKLAGDTINLTVTPTNTTSFPLQIREFIVKAIDNQDVESPLASVISKVPLYPQVDDIFDYSLLIKNNLVQ